MQDKQKPSIFLGLTLYRERSHILPNWNSGSEQMGIIQKNYGAVRTFSVQRTVLQNKLPTTIIATGIGSISAYKTFESLNACGEICTDGCCLILPKCFSFPITNIHIHPVVISLLFLFHTCCLTKNKTQHEYAHKNTLCKHYHIIISRKDKLNQIRFHTGLWCLTWSSYTFIHRILNCSFFPLRFRSFSSFTIRLSISNFSNDGKILCACQPSVRSPSPWTLYQKMSYIHYHLLPVACSS